jgi:hypothetical protein
MWFYCKQSHYHTWFKNILCCAIFFQMLLNLVFLLYNPCTFSNLSNYWYSWQALDKRPSSRAAFARVIFNSLLNLQTFNTNNKCMTICKHCSSFKLHCLELFPNMTLQPSPTCFLQTLCHNNMIQIDQHSPRCCRSPVT